MCLLLAPSFPANTPTPHTPQKISRRRGHRSAVELVSSLGCRPRAQLTGHCQVWPQNTVRRRPTRTQLIQFQSPAPRMVPPVGAIPEHRQLWPKAKPPKMQVVSGRVSRPPGEPWGLALRSCSSVVSVVVCTVEQQQALGGGEPQGWTLLQAPRSTPHPLPLPRHSEPALWALARRGLLLPHPAPRLVSPPPL